MDIKCVVCGEPWDAYGVSHGDMLAWQADLFRAGAGCPSCEGVRPEGGGFEPTGIHDLENGDEDPMDRIIAYENSVEGKAPEWKAPEHEVLKTCAGCGVQLIRDLAEVYDGTTRKPVYEWHLPRGAKAIQWWSSHRHEDVVDAEEAVEDHNWYPWRQLRVTVVDNLHRPRISSVRVRTYTVTSYEDVGRLREAFGQRASSFDVESVGREDEVCPCCYQMCNDCGEVAIATVMELEGDTYDLGSSFLPQGRHHTDDAVCIDCYEARCSTCGDRDCDCCTCDLHGGEPHEECADCCEHLGHTEPDDDGDCTRCWMTIDEEEGDEDLEDDDEVDPALRRLLDQGFDRSRASDEGGYCHVGCSQCSAVVINGVACHESGCPNAKGGE